MKTTAFVLLALLFTNISFSQTKNFIDSPYLETTANVDTMVVPDKIYLSILINEDDTKGKISVEELENKMASEIKKAGIDLEKQLTLSDLSSNFNKYFLKKQDILKSKSYELLVYDAKTAGTIIMALENIGISNVDLKKTEYSKMEELMLTLRTNAVKKAKTQAEAMLKPLNQTLGNAIFISDNTVHSNMVFGRAAGIQMAYREKTSTNYEPVPIEFEKIKVESEVHVKFGIQ